MDMATEFDFAPRGSGESWSDAPVYLLPAHGVPDFSSTKVTAENATFGSNSKSSGTSDAKDHVPNSLEELTQMLADSRTANASLSTPIDYPVSVPANSLFNESRSFGGDARIDTANFPTRIDRPGSVATSLLDEPKRSGTNAGSGHANLSNRVDNPGRTLFDESNRYATDARSGNPNLSTRVDHPGSALFDESKRFRTDARSGNASFSVPEDNSKWFGMDPNSSAAYTSKLRSGTEGQNHFASDMAARLHNTYPDPGGRNLSARSQESTLYSSTLDSHRSIDRLQAQMDTFARQVQISPRGPGPERGPLNFQSLQREGDRHQSPNFETRPVVPERHQSLQTAPSFTDQRFSGGRSSDLPSVPSEHGDFIVQENEQKPSPVPLTLQKREKDEGFLMWCVRACT